MRSMTLAKLSLAVAILSGPLAGLSFGLTLNSWKLAPPAIGNWNDSTNWSNGVPTVASQEVAIITNGGTASISQNTSVYDVVLGQAAGESGNLVQSNATLTLFDDLFVGEFGTGSYEFSGGVLQSGDVFVAARSGSHGTLRITGGMFKPGYLLMGRGLNLFPPATGGNAEVIQTGGTVEVFYAALTIEGNESSYHLQGGTLRALDQIVLGRGPNNRFVQSGGTNDAHSPSGGGYYSGALRVGLEADQLATYELSGGDLLTNYTAVGAYKGQGSFLQTGGQHHVYGNLGIAAEEMSAGSYEMREGTLLVDQALNVGSSANGTFATFGSGSSVQVRDLTVESMGSIAYSISGAGISPTRVTRNANVAGGIAVLDDGAPIGKFLLIDAVNSLTFNPTSIQLPGPAWSLQVIGKQVLVSNIPEPSTLAPMLMSMLALGCRKRLMLTLPTR